MSRTVRVTYHQELSSWWAESPDVPGYSAAGNTLEEVHRLVHDGLPFLLGEDDVVIDEAFPPVYSLQSTYGVLTVSTGVSPGLNVTAAVGSARLTTTTPAPVSAT